MKPFLLFISVLQIVYGSCPQGFDLVRDGECRGLLTTMQLGFESGTPAAIDKCTEIEGQPVIIHDEEHQTYWKQRAPQTADQQFLFIGIVCNTNTKKWEWSDGSAIDYKPSNGYNEQLDAPCTNGLSWDIHPDGYWSYGNFGAVTAYIACTKQLSAPTPSGGGCDGFDDDDDDGLCYQVSPVLASWKDGEKLCAQVGADLATIHNVQENSFVRRTAVAKGATNGVFIGASIIDKKKEWIDGSAWDYENFYPGFPKTGFGDCIAMDTSSSSGQWMNMDCNSKLPIACVRKQHAVVQPVCTTEDFDEGQIITSPGFPFSASTPCDYFLTVEAGKKVELEITLLEANSCCDHLILYDGYLGGSMLVNLSGDIENAKFTTTTSNIMRVSWQPNGGSNVRGLVMKYRGVN